MCFIRIFLGCDLIRKSDGYIAIRKGGHKMPRNTKTLTLDEALNIIKDIILEAKKDKREPIRGCS